MRRRARLLVDRLASESMRSLSSLGVHPELGSIMTDSLQGAKKRDGHELAIRNVVDFAHEVRIHLHDAQVIFGSVTAAADSQSASFRIRPWGVAESMNIQFDEVSLASPVKQMGWDRYRAIAVAQQAGIFSNARRVAK
jgi:hypothetical protein